MKITPKIIKTPIGNFKDVLNPHFKEELEKCNTNEDLFALVEYKGFINPDAFQEVISRSLYFEYCKWKKIIKEKRR